MNKLARFSFSDLQLVRNTGQENNCLKKENRLLNKQLQSCQEAEKIALEGLNIPVNILKIDSRYFGQRSTGIFNSLVIWNSKRLSLNLQTVFLTTAEKKSGIMAKEGSKSVDSTQHLFCYG